MEQCQPLGRQCSDKIRRVARGLFDDILQPGFAFFGFLYGSFAAHTFINLRLRIRWLVLTACTFFPPPTHSFQMSLFPLGCFLWCFKSIFHCNTGGCTVGVLVDEIITKTLAVDIGSSDYDVIMLVIRIVMPGNDIRTRRNIIATCRKLIKKVTDNSSHLIASVIRHRAEQGCFFRCERDDNRIALCPVIIRGGDPISGLFSQSRRQVGEVSQ